MMYAIVIIYGAVGMRFILPLLQDGSAVLLVFW